MSSQLSRRDGGDSDDDLGPVIIRFGIAMIIIPVVTIALRFWSRALGLGIKSSNGSRFWWDDWLALAVIPFSICESVMFMCWTRYGLGKHMDTLEPWQIELGLKILYAVYHPYNIAVALTKLSVIFFYARVFTTHNKWFRYSLWASGFIVIGILTFSIFESIFQCTPIARAWIPTLDGTCVDEQSAWYAHAALSMVTDVIILTLPLPMLWKLQLKWSQKALISGVFICGYGVTAISIGRLIANIRTPLGALFADITWNVVPILYWLLVEAPLSLMSICLPNIFTLVKRGVTDGPRSVLSSRYGKSVVSSGKRWTTSGDHGFALNNRGQAGRSTKGFENLDAKTSMEPLYESNGTWVTTVSGGPRSTSSHVAEQEDVERDSDLGRIHVRKEVDIES